MPHLSNRRQGVPNPDKLKFQELKIKLLKDHNTRSLSEDTIKKMIKDLNEAVLWLLEHFEGTMTNYDGRNE